MSLDEMIKLCEKKQKTLKDYKSARELIEKEYDKLSEPEQYILGEYLEFLELRIDMLEREI